ncbi:hypothetical protein ABZ864_29765 [Streptomyces sp. NPDC047082]|uniref:hypothetical protein n=1 Tax=Streptomyces sp. NPDC047082 TaxID=3155259 RepID=UPI0034014E14
MMKIAAGDQMSIIRQRPNAPGRAGTLLLAAVVMLVGCTSESEEEAAPKRPHVQVPRLTNANSREMPLDEYLLNPAQLESVSSAYSMSIANCMREYGFTYPASDSFNSGIGADAPKSRVDGRFGFQSMTHAKKWGYHPAGGFPVDKQQRLTSNADPEKWFTLTGTRDLSENSGPGGNARNGHRIPSHGCVGDALLEITGSRNGIIGDAEVATDLKFKTLVDAQKDPRTLKVFDLWSRCMRGYKYSYRSPLGAMSDARWGKSDRPSSAEIRTAVADQKCRSRHNVVGVWFAADFEHQEQAVNVNHDKLAEVKKQLTHQVQAAQKILNKSKRIAEDSGHAG